MNKPLNWLLLVPGLNPRQGGIQVSALDLLAGVPEHDLKCLVYGQPPTPPLQSRTLLHETSKLRLPIRCLLRQWPMEVAICWHLSMLRLLPYLRGFRGKVVVFLHGIEAWRQQPPGVLKQLPRVDLFLSNSDFTWQRFLQFCPQAAKTPHITTALGFGQPLESPPPHPAERPHALIIARMAKGEDYKGHRELISAWPALLSQIPDAHLDVVGEGDLRPDLEKMVQQLGLQANVTFHGRVDEQTKQRLLQQCAVMTLPSRAEGFGIVYLEAMRYGRPCLVSHCDAGREVVNPPEAGLAVDAGNPEKLLDALKHLLSIGPQWQAWSQGAIHRYTENYSVRRFQNRVLAAVQSLNR